MATKAQDLEKIKELVTFMKDSGVHSFEAMGVKVEFSIGGSGKVLTIDDEAQKLQEIREMVKSTARDEQVDLNWSV